MSKNNIILIVVAIVTLLTFATYTTYSYFSNTADPSGIANLNITSESNNMVFDTLGGGMILNITASNMNEFEANTIAAQNITTLTVNFQSNTDYDMVCTYDIVYEWTSIDKYQAHTSGVTQNEFTIQAALANNAHVSEGTNNIARETDFTTAVGSKTSATVVEGAQIDSSTSMSTAVWTITSKYYNVDANQNALSDKTYEGSFKVSNVSCVAGTVTETIASGPTSYWYPESVWTNYTFPEAGGTVQTNGPATGHNVYIGQDRDKYYACLTYQNHEACLSEPYTQYGLAGHMLYDKFTSVEQANAKQAIYQILVNAGINVNIDEDCNANDERAYCHFVSYGCEVNYYGYVYCYDYTESLSCEVDPNNNARCTVD